MKNFSTNQPCVCCGEKREGMVCLHHVYTKKAYPEHSLSAWNLMPICLLHHVEIHQKGAKYMVDKYPGLKKWLISHGWEFDSFKEKWIHENF